MLNVRWITATLQTAESTNLRKITIVVTSCDTPADPVEERVHREWQGLDHLLVRLWTSRSIRPKIKYKTGAAEELEKLIWSLLPNLVHNGAISRARR